MPITKIGLNLSFESLPPINISSIPTNATAILTQTPQLANSNTLYYYAFIILIPIWIISYLAFSDRSQFSEFKFGDVRAINLAFGVSSLIAITNAEIGFFMNLQTVAFFVVMFMLSWWAMWAFENKE